MQHFYGAYTVPLYFHDNAVRLFALTVQRPSRPDAEGSVWARTLVGGDGRTSARAAHSEPVSPRKGIVPSHGV